LDSFHASTVVGGDLAQLQPVAQLAGERGVLFRRPKVTGMAQIITGKGRVCSFGSRFTSRHHRISSPGEALPFRVRLNKGA
jgi:hypothetical protein